VLPRASLYDVQFMDVAVSDVDDLLSLACIPRIGAYREIRDNWAVSECSQVGVHPRASFADGQFVNVGIRDIDNLFHASCLPSKAANVRGFALRSPAELDQVGVLPRASLGNVQFVNVSLLPGINHLLCTALRPIITNDVIERKTPTIYRESRRATEQSQVRPPPVTSHWDV